MFKLCLVTLEVDSDYAQIIPYYLWVEDWPSFYAFWLCQHCRGLQFLQQRNLGLLTGRATCLSGNCFCNVIGILYTGLNSLLLLPLLTRVVAIDLCLTVHTCGTCNSVGIDLWNM